MAEPLVKNNLGSELDFKNMVVQPILTVCHSSLSPHLSVILASILTLIISMHSAVAASTISASSESLIFPLPWLSFIPSFA